MEVICSICRCPISKNPPEGSTDLADMCEEMQTPDPVELPKKTKTNHDNAPNIVSTPCGHLFHNSCLTQWYLMIGNRRCPLCNYVTPVHGMIRVFLTMDKKGEGEKCCGGEEEEGRPAESRPVTAEGDKGGTDVDVVVEAEDFPRQENEERLEEEDTSEPVPMQVTDTTRNRIRGMIYHFRPSASSSPEELLEIFPSRDSQQQQQQQRGRLRVPPPPTRRRERSPRHCNGCANYSRIQALMTNDLQDLRDLVAEQSAKIQSLEEQRSEPSHEESHC